MHTYAHSNYISCSYVGLSSDLKKSTVVDENLSVSINPNFCYENTFNYSMKVNRMRNLHKYIQENYGREAMWELWKCEKWELRYSGYSNHRRFTLRCISKGIVPVSLKLNSRRKDIRSRVRAIIYRAERQLLQEREALTPFFWTVGVG